MKKSLAVRRGVDLFVLADTSKISEDGFFLSFVEDVFLVINMYKLISNRLERSIDACLNKEKSIYENIESYFNPLKYCSISEKEANQILQSNPLNGMYLIFSEKVVDILDKYSQDNSSSLCWIDNSIERRLTTRECSETLRDNFYVRKNFEEKFLIYSKNFLVFAFFPLAIISSFVTALNSAKEYEKTPINPDNPEDTFSKSYGNLAVMTELLLNNYLISAGLLLIYFNYFVESLSSSPSSVFMLTSGSALTPASDFKKVNVMPLKLFTKYLGTIHKCACGELERYYDEFNNKAISGNCTSYTLSPTIVLFTKSTAIGDYPKLKSRLLNGDYENFVFPYQLGNCSIDYNEYKDRFNCDFFDDIDSFKQELIQTSNMIGMDTQIKQLSEFAIYLYIQVCNFFERIELASQDNPDVSFGQEDLKSFLDEVNLESHFPIILQGPPGTGKSEIQVKFNDLIIKKINTESKCRKIEFYVDSNDKLIAAVGDRATQAIQRKIDNSLTDSKLFNYKTISKAFNYLGLMCLLGLLVETHRYRSKYESQEMSDYSDMGNYVPEGRLYNEDYGDSDKFFANIVDPFIKVSMLLYLIGISLDKYLKKPIVPYKKLDPFGIRLDNLTPTSAFYIQTYSHISLNEILSFYKNQGNDQSFRAIGFMGASNDTDLTKFGGKMDIILFNSVVADDALDKKLEEKIKQQYNEVVDFFKAVYFYEYDYSYEQKDIDACKQFFNFRDEIKIDRQSFVQVYKYFIKKYMDCSVEHSGVQDGLSHELKQSFLKSSQSTQDFFYESCVGLPIDGESGFSTPKRTRWTSRSILRGGGGSTGSLSSGSRSVFSTPKEPGGQLRSILKEKRKLPGNLSLGSINNQEPALSVSVEQSRSIVKGEGELTGNLSLDSLENREEASGNSGYFFGFKFWGK